MKKLFTTIALCFVSLLAFPQKKIDSFLGLKFGSSKEGVIAIAKAKGGIYNAELSKPGVLFYNNVKIGQRTTYSTAFSLHEGKFYQGTAYFEASSESGTIDLYEALIEEITGVYGKGDSYRNFDSPFEEGDGHELTAIKLEKATFSTFWKTTLDNGQENYISLEITDNLLVKMVYQDSELTDKAIEKRKAANMSDL